MHKFSFRSAHFELDLEGYENPIDAFKQVVSALDKSDISVSLSPIKNNTPEVEKPPTIVDANPASHVDIDEFFADKKPAKIRQLLEGTAQYLTKHQGKFEFTADELFEAAKSSLYYDATWSKNRGAALTNMIKTGFLAKRPEGRLRVKAE